MSTVDQSFQFTSGIGHI